MGRAAAWLKRCVDRAAGWSLFWMFTIAAIALLGMVAIAIGAIIYAARMPASVATLLGTAIGLLGYTARDVVGAIARLLGSAPRPEGEE